MPFVQFLTLEGADLESLDVRTQKRNPGNWVAQLFIKCRYIQLFCNYINSEIWQFRKLGNSFQRVRISRHTSFYYALLHFADIEVFID